MEIGKMNSNGSGKPSATPCDACKILRRRCGEKCLLAPYFPSNNPHKFVTANHFFGASNMIDMLKDLPADQRGDAVSSMVYETSARLRDPVYGCAGTVFQLQQKISHLQSQLAAAQAKLLRLRSEHSNLAYLVSQLSTSEEEAEPISPTESDPHSNNNITADMEEYYSDEMDPSLLWEPHSP